MKALILNPAEHSASVQEVPPPKPKGKELLVKVHSVALNPVDAIYVAHPIAAQPDRTLGSDFAGEVVAMAEELGDSIDDPRVKVGARVAGLLQGACSVNERPGAFAEYLAIDWDLVYLVPPTLSYSEAATIPLTALTAAQGVYYRLGLPCPFWKQPLPGTASYESSESGPITVFVYGASTSVAMYAAQHIQAAKGVSGRPIKLIGAASTKNHASLKAQPYLYDELVDYRDNDWIAQVRNLAGGKGVDFAVDCISEWPIVKQVNETLGEKGKQAVFRSKQASPHRAEWEQLPNQPIYGAVWEGLGHEIHYHAGVVLPVSTAARDFAVAFFGYLTKSATAGKSAIQPNPVRLMPGGLDRIAPDGLVVQSPGLLSAPREQNRTEEYMRPISGEKLVYNIA